MEKQGKLQFKTWDRSIGGKLSICFWVIQTEVKMKIPLRQQENMRLVDMKKYVNYFSFKKQSFTNTETLTSFASKYYEKEFSVLLHEVCLH